MKVLSSIQLVLGEFISTVENWHGVHESIHQEMLSTLLAVMLAETVYAIKKVSLKKGFIVMGDLLVRHTLWFILTNCGPLGKIKSQEFSRVMLPQPAHSST